MLPKRPYPGFEESIFGHKLLILLVGAQGLEPWTR